MGWSAIFTYHCGLVPFWQISTVVLAIYSGKINSTTPDKDRRRFGGHTLWRFWLCLFNRKRCLLLRRTWQAWPIDTPLQHKTTIFYLNSKISRLGCAFQLKVPLSTALIHSRFSIIFMLYMLSYKWFPFVFLQYSSFLAHEHKYNKQQTDLSTNWCYEFIFQGD